MRTPSLKNILIIEDNHDYQTLLTFSHQRSHNAWRYDFADSAEHAHVLLAKKQTAPEVLLIDYDLPGSNGIEFLDELKQSPAYGNIPVFMFSFYETPQMVREAYAHGVTAFITKSDNYTSLVNLWSGLGSLSLQP